MTKDEIKGILEKQLRLLSEISEECKEKTPFELPALTQAMLSIAHILGL